MTAEWTHAWTGQIAFEELETIDQRIILEGALEWTLPIPIFIGPRELDDQLSSQVGICDYARRVGTTITASGSLSGYQTYDDVTVGIDVTTNVGWMTYEDDVMKFKRCELRALTLGLYPAWQDARIHVLKRLGE